MATSVKKLRMNSKGAVAVLQSQGVIRDLHARGKAIESKLPTSKGEAWETQTRVGFDRASTVVRAANVQAARTNAETTALLRALNAGGDSG